MFLLLDVHAFGLAYGSELLKPFIDVEKIAYWLGHILKQTYFKIYEMPIG
jgi:hypothetical protein